MHKEIIEGIITKKPHQQNETYDYWAYLFEAPKNLIEKIVFESEKTDTQNTLCDFSFPYKLKGKAAHPPMSSMVNQNIEDDIVKRCRKLAKRLSKLEIKTPLKTDIDDGHSNIIQPILIKNDTGISNIIDLGADFNYSNEHDQNNIYNSSLFDTNPNKANDCLSVNIDYTPQMLESIDEKIIFLRHMEESMRHNFTAEPNDDKEKSLEINPDNRKSVDLFDKESCRILENIFYPYKSMGNQECELAGNNTLLLYQIKKEEVEKILNLAQSLEEQEDFVAEKFENKHDEYYSEHLCEIKNFDQRPVKKIFIAFPKKNDFRIDLETIHEGRDKRTTCMIKNIPNKYTQTMLMEMLDEHHKGQYDFVYLRMDFKNKCNVGYAFVNFIDYKVIPSFFSKINSKGWKKYKSNKIAELTYASIQGIENLIKKFKKSNIMCEQQEYRPKVYYRDGPLKGMEWDVMNDE